MSEEKSLNFIEEIIEKDIAEGIHEGRVHTRFPPEPNGYLHIGHSKAICLNFGLAKKYQGKCNLRFDDTNPEKEEVEYVDSIKEDIQWLGFRWDNEFYASDYFDKIYGFAVALIQKGLAYVDESSSEDMAKQKGTPTLAGTDSPYRNRSIEENLDLFTRMKNGEFADGTCVLRAKIDMKHDNMIMRDPVIYRIKHAEHHRTGNTWCIYPMYDFAHGQSDSIEEITHSICTLEFIPHRDLYNWCIQKLEIFPSRQYEFARLNMTYTLMSKRKLLMLVQQQFVEGWDDPRMPTISGFRRRGYTPESIREFCDKIGIAKRDNMIDISLLDFCLRDHLNKIALRRMAVLHPVKLIITNYEEGKTETLSAENNPEDENAGHRALTFGKELWIEREDFMENPSKKYFRLGPGLQVRLKHAYIIECTDFKKDADGTITEIHCKYFPESKSGNDQSGLKVKGTMHWLHCDTALQAEVRLYDRLFTVENPAAHDGDLQEILHPKSLEVISKAYIEPALAAAKQQDRFQFLRLGYFCVDKNSSSEKLIFNKTTGLKDSFAKVV
ncbi:MAG: glutamine--tRNA ligase/YqeY domain fusion protein [Bacteroidetes bacterium]|nr:glutamine--tRNA ligase/YqeY domain fusion protein [Bacteroidota bacterium]